MRRVCMTGDMYDILYVYILPRLKIYQLRWNEWNKVIVETYFHVKKGIKLWVGLKLRDIFILVLAEDFTEHGRRHLGLKAPSRINIY